MTEMLICEKLFLLLTKDSGSFETSNSTYGLNGALLIDLLLAGRVALGEGRNPRISIVSSAPTGHPVLDRALQTLPARNGKRVSSLVSWGELNPARDIAASLSAAGIITVDTSGFFGSLSPKYPTVDPVPEQQLRSHIYAVLRGEQIALEADCTILSILQALGIAARVLPLAQTRLSRGNLKRRIKEISQSNPAGSAVSRAVNAANGAIIAVITGSAAMASS